MIVEIICLLFLGGIAELDRTCVFHGLLSEPIVLAPVVGYVLGEPMLGLKIGAVLQLFFLGGVSMGGTSPLDGAMASVAVMASTVAAKRFVGVDSDFAYPAAIMLVMTPAAMVGRAIDIWVKENNVTLLHDVEEAIEANGVNAIDKAVWKGIWKSFIVFTPAVGIVSVIGAAITVGAVYIMPKEWEHALKVTGILILVASAGIALASLREKKALWAYFCAGLLLWIITIFII